MPYLEIKNNGNDNTIDHYVTIITMLPLPLMIIIIIIIIIMIVVVSKITIIRVIINSNNNNNNSNKDNDSNNQTKMAKSTLKKKGKLTQRTNTCLCKPSSEKFKT